ncbi:MAG TPA: radical SAM family heme chaperone HemW [Terriglobales bacterium]|nr:radical SAM family heme chaperone HemW [Terriglobales bacterium]
MPTGLYISVPFCRSKCSYCNFASDVFSRTIFQGYVERICADLQQAQTLAAEVGGCLENQVDSIYLGGGTPTLLDITGLERLFVTISQNFHLTANAEITVECAPGTLNDSMIAVLMRCGVNRVSLGVQSFVDQEARSVGRLHTRAVVLDDITRLRGAGISNINVDLIAGLPHQSMASWLTSIEDAIHSDAPHVSIYMLEVDEDSRLGRELIAGGTKYHAHFVPDEDLTADLYEAACERLHSAGIEQYEISNFAKAGKWSLHNLKYWLRKPYLGLGVDAHSMLFARDANLRAVRFSMPDSVDGYMRGSHQEKTAGSATAFLQEAFFLGLRLNQGVDIQELRQEFGNAAVDAHTEAIADLVELKLLQSEGERFFLTPRGRLLSNEVFQRFLSASAACESSR